MIRTIEHQEITAAEAGALQLVEVLPHASYEKMHLPNAESIPLKQLNRDAVAHLKPEQTVAVYCWDAY